MEHRSISGVSVSSVYDDVLHLDDSLDGAKMKGKVGDEKKWDRVRSMRQLRRSNPEVDHYVFGIAR